MAAIHKVIVNSFSFPFFTVLPRSAAVLSMVVRSCQGTFSAAPEMNIIDELVCPAPPM